MLIQLLACHPANFIGENTTMRGSDTFSSNIRSILPWVSLSLGIPSGCLPQIYPFSISMCQKCTISHYIINDKKHQRKMGRICCSIPQSSIWCICRFPMISLENLWGLPLKSLSYLLWIHQNPYEFCRESLENPWEIHIFNFRVDSCFTYHPIQISTWIPLHQVSTIHGDSPAVPVF